MNILIVADCHYPTFKQIEQICLINPNNFNVVCYVGDNDQFLIEELKHNFNKKIHLGVLGNHDFYDILSENYIINIDKKKVNFDNFSFVGIEGSVKIEDMEDFYGYTQNGSLTVTDKLGRADIIISHTSPFGVHEIDKESHIGYIGLKEYIDKNNPKYCIHGHQHIDKQTVLKNGTMVIGVYSVSILDTTTKSIEKII